MRGLGFARARIVLAGPAAASLPRGRLALLVLRAVALARRRWERRQKTGAKKAGGSPLR